MMISIINDDKFDVGRLGVVVYIGGGNYLSFYGNHVAIWTVVCLAVYKGGVVHLPFFFSLFLFVLLLYRFLLLLLSFSSLLSSGSVLSLYIISGGGDIADD